MPTETERIQAAKREEVKNYYRALPYISKSRLKTYVTCPKKFFFKYILGRRGDPTFYTARGTQIHRAFEHFYENVRKDKLSAFRGGSLRKYLPGIQTGEGREGAADWADHIVPFIGNFLRFEKRRRDNADILNQFIPVGIESEGWVDYDWNDSNWDVPLMGFADLVVRSASLSDDIVEADHGVTILDFKTGSVPDEKYRDEGIYLEQEYYAIIFEETMNPEVTGVAAYYPKSDTTIGAQLSNERRDFIDQKMHEMIALSFHAEKDWFPIEEQPLCAWSNHRGEGMCDHYSDCESEWGMKHFNGPTYQHAIDAKPDGFLEDKAEPKDVDVGDGLYNIS